jgi:putative MATE family efflux protein
VRLSSQRRDVFRLALPALGALIAEPLFLLTDTAMIGHLGAGALASLGLAGVILQTVVGLMIFLAYATTPRVARLSGAGKPRAAWEAGIDGLWFAAGSGALLIVVGFSFQDFVVSAFGAEANVNAGAIDYLSISWWGIPGMLLVLAATGVLRGVQDTMTPFIVSAVGFGANAVLNAVLIWGLGLGLIGSALGTVIAQWLMAVVLITIVMRRSHQHGASAAVRRTGITKTGSLGGWLFIRTVSLRVAFIAATVVAAGLGTVELAAWHVAFTVFSLLALALDSLAIAAQTLVGHRLGAEDGQGAKSLVSTLTRDSVIAGVGLGVVLAATSPLLVLAVTSDSEVRQVLLPVLLTLALALPIGGPVFVLDGVLMGAGDVRYLAWTGVVNVAVLLPLLWLVHHTAQPGASPDTLSVVALQASVGFGYLGARWLTLGLRARGTRWLVVGAETP